MGLDMYAYLLRADLAPKDVQTDVKIDKCLYEHYAGPGFVKELDEARELLDSKDPERVALERQAREFKERAHAEKLMDGDFAYWRKFNALHGWMEQLYRRKGGTSESFNLCTLRLTREDLEQLMNEAAGLEPKKGFFFGSTAPIEPGDVANVARFAAEAMSAIDAGYAVYYDSWW